MKNLKSNFVLIFCLFSIFSFSQKDSVYVVKETDVMTSKSYYYPSRVLVVSDESGKTGFKIDCYIKDDGGRLSDLLVTMVNIGSCNENDELIILFENGEKITKTSWKKFNCKGEAYFTLDSNDIELLKSNKISKIRMTNGYSFQSFTGDVKSKDKRFFIQLLYGIENKLSVIKK